MYQTCGQRSGASSMTGSSPVWRQSSPSGCNGQDFPSSSPEENNSAGQCSAEEHGTGDVYVFVEGGGGGGNCRDDGASPRGLPAYTHLYRTFADGTTMTSSPSLSPNGGSQRLFTNAGQPGPLSPASPTYSLPGVLPPDSQQPPTNPPSNDMPIHILPYPIVQPSKPQCPNSQKHINGWVIVAIILLFVIAAALLYNYIKKHYPPYGGKSSCSSMSAKMQRFKNKEKSMLNKWHDKLHKWEDRIFHENDAHQQNDMAYGSKHDVGRADEINSPSSSSSSGMGSHSSSNGKTAFSGRAQNGPGYAPDSAQPFAIYSAEDAPTYIW
jgi:hypothetical protein